MTRFARSARFTQKDGSPTESVGCACLVDLSDGGLVSMQSAPRSAFSPIGCNFSQILIIGMVVWGVRQPRAGSPPQLSR